jgi:GNAT superfamily N-acetyltransferase
MTRGSDRYEAVSRDLGHILVSVSRIRPLLSGWQTPAVLRPAREADRDEVIRLALAEDVSWFGASEYTAEEMGEFIDEIGISSGVVATRPDGSVRGYAAVGAAKESLLVIDAADPEPPYAELVSWMRDRGGSSIYTYGKDTARHDALQAAGWHYAFSSYDLARPSAGPVDAPQWPAGIDVATFVRGEDDERVHHLIYVDAAWGDQPGHLSRPLNAWQRSIGPEERGWIALRDDRPVGVAIGRNFADGRAYVHQLAVASDVRRSGLGRALLLHAYTELLAAGATSLTLNVQASNERALGLYRSIGLDIVREWRIFQPV